MRIAVWHNLPSGGAKRALYYQVRGLVQRGHDVEYWALSSADRSFLPLSDLASEHVVPLRWKPYSGKRTLRSAARYLEALSLRRAIDTACRESAAQIDAGEFDVALVGSCRYLLVPPVTRYLKTPTALYLQEPNRYLYEARPVLPWAGAIRLPGEGLAGHARRAAVMALLLPLLRLSAKDEWRSVHACRTLLVNSYYSRESMLRSYGRDAEVCYLGVDTELFEYTRREREPFVVGVSALDRAKGIELAIQVVSLLREPRPRLLWVANVGEPAYRDELTRLASRLGVDLEVRMRVPDAELVAILNRASLMLYTPRLEPFGLAPLEAGSCGTPVVAAAEGGVRETILHGVNGLLVDRSPRALARAAQSLLDDPVLARRLGEQAAEHVRSEWTLSQSIDRLEAYLHHTASCKERE